MIRLLAVAAAMALLCPALSQAQTKDETNKPAAAAPAKPAGEAKPAAEAKPPAAEPAKRTEEAKPATPAPRHGTMRHGATHHATTHHGTTHHRTSTHHAVTGHGTSHHRTTHRTVTGHHATTRETASSRPLPPRNHQFYHRGQYFNQVHAARFVWPHGWRYRQWRIGARFPVIFLAPTYFYTDYAAIGLQAPASGYAWVRFGPDLVLVNLTTHEVEDVILGVFIV